MSATTIYAGIQGVNLSNYAQLKLLDTLNGKTQYTMPTTYVALATNAQYTITAISIASSAVITCGANLATGKIVKITGSNSTPSLDGTYQITNVDATKFSIPFTTSGSGSAGTVTLSAGDSTMGFTFTETTPGTLGYARAAFGPATATGAPAVSANTSQISIGPNTTTPWGTVTGIGVYDATTSGNLLWAGDLATAVAIIVNDVFIIAAGALTVTMD